MQASTSVPQPERNHIETDILPQDRSAFSSNTSLINFCNSTYLRTKRKLDPSNATKVLTIDSDYKLKKPASTRLGGDVDAGAIAPTER